MAKNKKGHGQRLSHHVDTRLNDAKFQELQQILEQAPGLDMSGLIRLILYNRPVKMYVHDRSLDLVMEEMAKLRSELKAIGININQITRQFNSYPEPHRKAFYAKIAFQEYLAIEAKIDKLLMIGSKLAKIWLQE